MKTKTRARLFSIKYLLYDITKVTAAIPGLLAFRPKILYQSPSARKRIRGGAILIGNHAGFFDPVFMQYGVWYRRHHFICAKEFFERKGKFFFRHFLCIPIDRDNFGIDSFREITEHLRGGELISLFPEGMIADGVHSFKSGMVLMAMQGNAPIVPIYIMRRKNNLQRLVMAIGEPLDVGALCGRKPMFSRVEEITGLLYDREMQLKELCERRGRK